MIEPIKDLYQYLGIKFTHNGRGLFEINTIVNVNNQSQKRLTKKSNRTGLQTLEEYLNIQNTGWYTPDSIKTNKFAGWSLTELEYLLSVKLKEYELTEGIARKAAINNEIDNIREAIGQVNSKPKEQTPNILSKVELLANYLKSNSGELGLVKGFILNKTKLVTSTKYLLTNDDLLQIKYGNLEYLVEVFRVIDNKLIRKLEKRNAGLIRTISYSNIEELITLVLKVKLVSVTNSVELFGLSDERNKILEYHKDKTNSFIDNFAFYKTKSKKLNSNTYTILIKNIDNKPIKFLLQDIEIVNPELKGYTLQKYHHYKVSSKVKIKNSNIEGTIVSIKSNESSKRINKTNLRRLDVVSVRTDTNIINIRAKNLILMPEKVKEELPF